MKFLRVTTSTPVAAYIANRLLESLNKNQKTTWLIPGGSNIGVAVEVGQLLQGNDLSNLSISLTDERHGSVGHTDSNWAQLETAGFYPGNATLYPVLHGQDMATDTVTFTKTLHMILDESDYSLGFFGIGPDGHTAGILPGSSSVTASDFAASYSANFERITMTALAIARLSEVVAYTTGEAKWPVLDQLEQVVDPNIQPAQFLKTVSEFTVFNDYKGEES